MTDNTPAAWPHNGHYEQRAVMQFLVTIKSSVRNAAQHLSSACGGAAIDSSTVGHWAKGVMASETARAELCNLPCSGRSVIAVSHEMLQHADAIVHED